jgi:hypothetical protein
MEAVMKSKPTDTERLAWLVRRMDYMEHTSASGLRAVDQPGPSGYWSRGVTEDNWADTCPAANESPDCAGQDLIDYIDWMIELERGK